MVCWNREGLVAKIGLLESNKKDNSVIYQSKVNLKLFQSNKKARFAGPFVSYNLVRGSCSIAPATSSSTNA